MSVASSDTHPAGRKHAWLAALLIMCLSVLVYLPAGDNDFVDFDDGAYVTKNPVVQAGLSAEGLRWAFSETHSSNWHPLTWLSHMIDCEWFGLEPRGHHMMAVGLHALAAALCFLSLLVLTRAFWPSLLVGLFFALHPQRVESVAWISERKDVLSGVFFFGCLLAYGLYACRGGKLYYFALFVSLALGLLAKQMLVTLPCLLLVLDQWPLGRFSRMGLKRCLLEKLPLFGLVIGAGVMTLYAQSTGGAMSTLQALPVDARLANAFWSTAAYIGQMLWPVDLAFYYPHPYLVMGDEYQLWSLANIGSALLVLALSCAAFLTRKSQPWLLSGWLWYLGLLAPVVGILHVGTQSMADRYAYLPTIGLYIAIIWSLAHLAKGHRQQRALVLAGLLLAAAMVLPTRAQIRTWKDSPTLFKHAIASTERNYIAHSNYGFYLQKHGQPEAAEQHYLEALKVSPKLVDAHSNLGAIYLDRQEWERARGKLKEALVINPRFLDALMLLGLLEESLGRHGAALQAYSRALQSNPGYLIGLVSRARMLRAQGRAPEALATLQAAQKRGAESADLWLELASAQRDSAQAAAAKLSFGNGLRRYPGNQKLRVAAAWFFASCADASLRNAARATQLLDGLEEARDWKTLRARAAARAACGDFPAARRLALDASMAAPESERASLHKAFEAYKQGQLRLR